MLIYYDNLVYNGLGKWHFFQVVFAHARTHTFQIKTAENLSFMPLENI